MENSQQNTCYNFRVGSFKCKAVSDGSFDYNPLSLFSNQEKAEIIQNLKDYPLIEGKIRSPYTFLYVDTGTHKILTDTGAGSLGPNTGKLASNLRKAGVDPGEIDVVIITHAHPDHVGGTLDEHGNPIYPEAEYYILKKEWEFWFSDEAYRKATEHLSAILAPEVFIQVARGQLGPMKHRMKLISDAGEIFPGVFVHPTPGHTPGHVAVSFSSQGKEVCFVGDAVVFPFMISNPHVIPRFDMIPELAVQTRKDLFDLLASKNALVQTQHFPPFPGLGHITKSEKGWSWDPVRLD